MTRKDTARDVEHKPSIRRQRTMQNAAMDELNDDSIPMDDRRENLMRMRRWLDTLIEQADGDIKSHVAI